MESTARISHIHPATTFSHPTCSNSLLRSALNPTKTGGGSHFSEGENFDDGIVGGTDIPFLTRPGADLKDGQLFGTWCIGVDLDGIASLAPPSTSPADLGPCPFQGIYAHIGRSRSSNIVPLIEVSTALWSAGRPRC